MEESSPGTDATGDSSDVPPKPRKSITKYSGLNPDFVGTPSTPPGTDRFIFVNAYESSSSGQEQATDRKTINAHVQTTAYRQRRSAAVERLKRNVKTNIGRSRPGVALPSETNRVHSQASTLVAATPLKAFAPPRGRGAVRTRLGSANRPIIDDTNTLAPITNEGDSEDEDDAHLEIRTMRRAIKSISSRMNSLEKSRSLHGSPQSLLDSADIDPFAVASIPITKGMNKIFSHFIEVMIPGVFPIRSQAIAQSDWAMSLAFTQPLVLFSILAVAAAELQARSGHLGNGSVETTYTERDLVSRTVPDFVGYKLRAIKIANQKISNPEEAVSVSTIYALMCLLSIEVITGSKKEISEHVSGLQRLIALRGGYQGLPPHVTETVLSTTYICATMTGSLPPAPPSSSLEVPPSTLQTILSDIPPFLKDLGTALLTPGVAALFNWQVNLAFRDLREVVLYREYYHETGSTPPAAELDHFNIKSYNLRYLVLTVPLQMQTPVSDKQEACRIALLIFWNANYLIMQPDSALFRRLTTQLKTALEKSDFQNFWAPHYDLLMWVLFLGAHISAGQRERPWFVLNLARGARLLKLADWAETRTIMLRFLYLDRIYQKSFEQAWQEARMLMDMVGPNLCGGVDAGGLGP